MGKGSKREKKRETLAKGQVIRSRRTWKLQLCLGRSQDKKEGRQYQKINPDLEIFKLEGIYFQTLKVDSMRPTGLISCVLCKVLNVLTCY
jgi:hypothetical protein